MEKFLEYLNTPKEKVKINCIYKNEKLIDNSNNSLPLVSECYTTPVSFPEPGLDRPYLVSSIVLSSDGKMAFMDNKNGPLIAKNNFLDSSGGTADFWCLNMLRSYSDALIIGANTLNNEPLNINYCMEKELYDQRKEFLGKKTQPVQVIISMDGKDIPFGHKTFSIPVENELKVILASSPDGWEYIKENSRLKHILIGPFNSLSEVDNTSLPEIAGDYDCMPVIVTGEGKVPNIEIMLKVLRKLGVKTVCVESPTFCGALLDKQLLDEYFINYSMLFVGGIMSPSSLFSFSHLNHPHSELASVGIHQNNFLFTRQILRYNVKGE